MADPDCYRYDPSVSLGDPGEDCPERVDVWELPEVTRVMQGVEGNVITVIETEKNERQKLNETLARVRHNMALDQATLARCKNEGIKDLSMYTINLSLLEIQENQILADLNKFES